MLSACTEKTLARMIVSGTHRQDIASMKSVLSLSLDIAGAPLLLLSLLLQILMKISSKEL
jgi:hypothetical protein